MQGNRHFVLKLDSKCCGCGAQVEPNIQSEKQYVTWSYRCKECNSSSYTSAKCSSTEERMISELIQQKVDALN